MPQRAIAPAPWTQPREEENTNVAPAKKSPHVCENEGPYDGVRPVPQPLLHRRRENAEDPKDIFSAFPFLSSSLDCSSGGDAGRSDSAAPRSCRAPGVLWEM
ncbi:hypothetical protein MHYP_G00154550 [Metynnis hypsauchen]